ncbi:MAG: SDR family NAD(P)-dependent oxidoreductase [Candidatus Hydrogenedentes bacterium]|nr:SDR family NAD(P)-dependent oxidoreductase [Candidatus Hydrogenedentota bacterium]
MMRRKPKRFSECVVIITGASSGIGEYTAYEFAKEGAIVALLARREEKLKQVKENITKNDGKADYFIADVTDYNSMLSAVEKIISLWGKIDVVLANAGIGVPGHIAKLKVEDFRRQFETNFFGVVNTIEITLPYLMKEKGRLGIVGSVAGKICTPMSAPYCSSKFAVAALAECSYFDLKPFGVSVTCINPGFVDSEIRKKNQRGEIVRGDPIPSFLVMPTHKAAKQIVNAIYKRKPEVLITKHAKVSVFFGRHFPRTYRLLLSLFSRRTVSKIPLPVPPYSKEDNI